MLRYPAGHFLHGTIIANIRTVSSYFHVADVFRKKRTNGRQSTHELEAKHDIFIYRSTAANHQWKIPVTIIQENSATRESIEGTQAKRFRYQFDWLPDGAT
jgi:hypothetical protein